MDVIKKLIEIDPSDVNYYRIFISTLLKKKQYDEAKEWIKKAEKLSMTEMDRAILSRYKYQAEAGINNIQK